MNRRHMTILILLLVLTPSLARADVGTPLMWASFLHLTLGNLVIGIGEGLLLARIFKVGKRSACLWMILANYVSAWAGIPILSSLGWVFNRRLPGAERLYHGRAFMLAVTLIIFLATIVIEWPFCRGVLKGRAHPWRVALLASLVAQSASYAILIPYYLNASFISVLTEARIEKDLHFAKTPSATVYYLSPDGKTVWRRRLDGTPAARVMDVKTLTEYDRLFAQRAGPGKSWDLWLLHRADRNEGDPCERLIANFAPRSAGKNDGTSIGTETAAWYNQYPTETHTWFNRYTADLRPKETHEWDARCGFWAAEGLRAWNNHDNQRYWLAMETPFAQWISRNLTILPGDQAVYQLGDMIVLLDLNTRQLAVVAMGHGPVVGIE